MDMDLAAGWTTYEWEAGPVPAYRARPAAAPDPLPAVIVIQEAWGGDDHIIDVAARLATAGYLTLAPDLYAAGGERPEPLRAERMEGLKRFMNTMPPSALTDTRSSPCGGRPPAGPRAGRGGRVDGGDVGSVDKRRPPPRAAGGGGSPAGRSPRRRKAGRLRGLLPGGVAVRPARLLRTQSRGRCDLLRHAAVGGGPPGAVLPPAGLLRG